jgi:hypothetical protein
MGEVDAWIGMKEGLDYIYLLLDTFLRNHYLTFAHIHMNHWYYVVLPHRTLVPL